MELGLDGTVAIVTGGGSNIGRAITHELGAAGATVAIFDRNVDQARRTAAEVEAADGSAVVYAIDLTDLDATQAAVAEVETDVGPVRTLVNNVGWNGRYGVRFNAVAPGLVIPAADAIGEGSLWQGEVGFGDKQIADMEAATPLRRRPEAVDIAWTVAFLVSERARMLTGQVLSVSGGFNMPR